MFDPKPTTRIFLARGRILELYVILTLVVPILLDLLFQGTKIARLSRVFLILVVILSVLVNHSLFLKNRIVGQDTIVVMVALYVLGTTLSVSHGGVLTPLFLSLLTLSLILALNIDCYEFFLNGVAWSAHILSICSVFAIFLKMNPTHFYLNDADYPVFFKQIGISGRNIGVFAHPNVLGEVAALSIVFILGSKTNKFLLIAPIFCLMKCGSRHAIFGVIVAALFLLLRKFLKKNELRKFGEIEFPWVLRIWIAGFLIVVFYKIIQSINFLDPGWFTGRAGVWQSTLALAKYSPLLGLGWDFEQRAISSNLLNTWAVSAHNNFLEIAFCTGFVGLFLFLLLYSKIIINFRRLLTIEKMLVLYIFTSGLVEYTIKFTYPSVTSFLFIFINIGANISQEGKLWKTTQ